MKAEDRNPAIYAAAAYNVDELHIYIAFASMRCNENQLIGA